MSELDFHILSVTYREVLHDLLTGDTKLRFTYQVVWEESEIQWASRWDTYLAMSDVQIHWFSIVNSVVVVFFLAGILTMIIVRTLRRDIAKYNKMDDEVRAQATWHSV